jgi:metal-responsive CopG/Arc/MetJ family transcriptional regulator
MNVTMFAHMDLKRINVMVPEDVHEILDRFQKKYSHRSKDKALAELLKAYENCEKVGRA